jgi:hypothetical protein
MTSPYDWMTDHWSLFHSGTDLDATETLYQLLKRHGIIPSEHIVYGEFRRFMNTQGCNSIAPFCFHAGRYIGNYQAVSEYVSGRGLKDETNISG